MLGHEYNALISYIEHMFLIVFDLWGEPTSIVRIHIYPTDFFFRMYIEGAPQSVFTS